MVADPISIQLVLQCDPPQKQERQNRQLLGTYDTCQHYQSPEVAYLRYHSSWTSNCWTQSDSSWTSLISEVKYSSPAYCRVPESNKTQLQQHNKEGNHSISNSYYLHDKSSYRKRNQLDLHELTGTKAFESSGQQPILGRLGTSDSDHHRGSM